MDFKYLSHEALIALEKYLDKKVLKKLVDIPSIDCVAKQLYVHLKLEDVKGNSDQIRKEIIEPACFQLAGELKLNKYKEFNTFYRVTPNITTQWSRSEINNISITVLKGYDIRANCEILSIGVGIIWDTK